MTKPTFEQFQLVAIRVVQETVVDEDLPDIGTAIMSEGEKFDFADHGIDSLDVLDIVYAIDKEMGVKIGLEQAMFESPYLTLGTLYKFAEPRDE